MYSLLIKRTGAFTSNSHAAFPYALASKADQTIFSEDSVPENFILSDPDHLNGFQINDLYSHWLKRQQKKLSPFVILNASPQHKTSIRKSSKAMGKRKMEYVEVDSNDEDVLSDEGEKHKEEEEEQSETGDVPVSGEDDNGMEEEQSETGDAPVGGEDDDGMAEEEEEETFWSIKYGPPARKNQPSTQVASEKYMLKKNGISRDPIKSAGPSSLPPPKNSATKSSTLNRKTSNTGAVSS